MLSKVLSQQSRHLSQTVIQQAQRSSMNQSSNGKPSFTIQKPNGAPKPTFADLMAKLKESNKSGGGILSSPKANVEPPKGVASKFSVRNPLSATKLTNNIGLANSVGNPINAVPTFRQSFQSVHKVDESVAVSEAARRAIQNGLSGFSGLAQFEEEKKNRRFQDRMNMLNRTAGKPISASPIDSQVTYEASQLQHHKLAQTEVNEDVDLDDSWGKYRPPLPDFPSSSSSAKDSSSLPPVSFTEHPEIKAVSMSDLKKSIAENIRLQKEKMVVKSGAQSRVQGVNARDSNGRSAQLSVEEEIDRRALLKSQKVLKKPKKAPKAGQATIKEVVIPFDGILLKELASKLSLKIKPLVKILLDSYGEDVNVTRITANRRGKTRVEESVEDKLIDADVAELLVMDMGLKVVRTVDHSRDGEEKPSELAAAALAAVGNTDAVGVAAAAVSVPMVLSPRAPVVCVMGHVDHGKTTLLDSLRNIKEGKMAGAEAGGITQKLSAFSVTVQGDKQVVFLDTPGHAAFSAMRQFGALATDLVVLVVAIDDGVRPQTLEAIKSALDAKCTIVVALNKVDKIVDLQDRAKARLRVLGQLNEHGIICEEFGGDVLDVQVSGKSGEGVNELIDLLLLQSDMMQLTACHTGQAEAVVLDASIEKGKGIVADVLVKWGALNVGDAVVVGSSFGRVKSMVNDKGESVKTAYPSDSVRLMGLKSVPTSGQEMLSVADEERAKIIVDRRERIAEMRLAEETIIDRTKAPRLEALVNRHKSAAQNRAYMSARWEIAHQAIVYDDENKLPTVNVVIKADGVGTVEALSQIVKSLASRTTDVTLNIVHSAVGAINSTDVERAHAVGNCMVLGFNVDLVDSATRSASKELDVEVHNNDVIYRLEDALLEAMQKVMPKERLLHLEGTAKVQKVFEMDDKRKTVVAGLMVTSGKLRTSGAVTYVYRVKRGDQEVLSDFSGEVAIKHFKESVHEMENGKECGLSLEKHRDFQEEDEIECLRVELKQKKLSMKNGVSGVIWTDSKVYDSTNRV